MCASPSSFDVWRENDSTPWLVYQGLMCERENESTLWLVYRGLMCVRGNDSTPWLVCRDLMCVSTAEYASVHASPTEEAHVHQDITCASKEHILWYNGAYESIPYGVAEHVTAYLMV